MTEEKPQQGQLPFDSEDLDVIDGASQTTASDAADTPETKVAATRPKATKTKKRLFKKVRKPEPLSEVVDSERIIAVPTIVAANSDDASVAPATENEAEQQEASAEPEELATDNTVDAPASTVEDEIDKTMAELSPLKERSHIDELFAEVAAEYEAAKQPKQDAAADDTADSTLADAADGATVLMSGEELDQAAQSPDQRENAAAQEGYCESESVFDDETQPVDSQDNTDDAGLFTDSQDSDEPVDDMALVTLTGDEELQETTDEDTPSNALSNAQSFLNKGSSSIKAGIAAMRDLNDIRHDYDEAQKVLANYQNTVQDLEGELEHRRELTTNYESIIATQGIEVEGATAKLNEATQRQTTFESQLEQGNEYLQKLKEANEQEVAPYRELASAARSALDGAEQMYRNARSNVRIAESQVVDTENSQEAQISNADRAITNAAQRLAELQDRVAEMKRSGSAGVKDLADMNQGVGAALAQLETAKNRKVTITRATETSVENARNQLSVQQQLQSRAEATLVAAQQDEQTKRAQFESLRDSVEAEESDIAEQLSEIQNKLEQAQHDQEEATTALDAAQAIIDEAQDVHDHPEATDELAKQLEEAQNAAFEQQAEVERLAAEVDTALENTEKMRIVLIGAAVVLVILLILIIWLFFIR